MCEKPDKDQTTVAPPTNAACSCAAGWLALGSLDTGSCYKRGESSAGETWAAARTTCQVGSDNLVIIIFQSVISQYIIKLLYY